MGRGRLGWAGQGQGGAAWRTTVLDEKLAGVGRALGERLAACEAQLAGEERDRRAAVDLLTEQGLNTRRAASGGLFEPHPLFI